jgi:hypothetical protein
VTAVEQADLAEPITLAELTDNAPADGRLQVPGQEHVERIRRVAFLHDNIPAA